MNTSYFIPYWFSYTKCKVCFRWMTYQYMYEPIDQKLIEKCQGCKFKENK